MASKTKKGRGPVVIELENARRVAKAAEKNLKTAEKSLATLKKNERRATSKLHEAVRSDEKSGTVSRAQTRARHALKSITQARRRNEKLVARQNKNVKEQRRLLKDLESQARTFDRDLASFYRSADATVAPAGVEKITGEQLRAARAMLRESQAVFAELLGLSVGGLRKLEKVNGPIGLEGPRLAEVHDALTALGLQLIGPGIYVGTGGPGVRLGSARARAAGSAPKAQARLASRRRAARAA